MYVHVVELFCDQKLALNIGIKAVWYIRYFKMVYQVDILKFSVNKNHHLSSQKSYKIQHVILLLNTILSDYNILNQPKYV